MLVQAWHAGNWDHEIYAIIKVEVKAVNETDTTLSFNHTGYPIEHEEHLET